MGFVKSPEEIVSTLRRCLDYPDVARLTLAWETRAEIVRKLLPPPLEPAPRPIAFAFVAHCPRTSFGASYQEAALFVRAAFNGELGIYYLSMLVTDDMAMALGREGLGLPKKMGQIGLRREGGTVEGWVERHGVRVGELRARLTGTLSPEDAADAFPALGSLAKSTTVAFAFKHFPAPDRMGFDYPPRLIRREIEFRPTSIEVGEGEIVLRSSDFDPWAELEVVRVLGAVYATGSYSMTRAAVVSELDGKAFAPYAFLKWDF